MIVTPKVATEKGKVVRDSEEQGRCLRARQEPGRRREMEIKSNLPN